ncbi:hypothetical protein Tco_0049355, partial [Tanacetum coccineum]
AAGQRLCRTYGKRINDVAAIRFLCTRHARIYVKYHIDSACIYFTIWFLVIMLPLDSCARRRPEFTQNMMPTVHLFSLYDLVTSLAAVLSLEEKRDM